MLNKHFSPVRLLPASGLEEFQQRHNQITPDLIILGINDFGTNHYQNGQSVKTVLECRNLFNAVPLVVFEDTYSIGSTSSYFQLGARGHLLKKCTENEFVKCIQRVVDDKYYLSPDLHIRTLAEGGVGNHDNLYNLKNLLSLRELQIAIYLSRGEGTMSIANLLNCSPSAVSTIKRKILVKLEVNNTIELAGKINAFSVT